VHQSPFIPDGSWFNQFGAAWVLNAGLQPGRPPLCIVLDIDDAGVPDICRRRAMHRPQGAVAAAGGADHLPAGVAHILGSDCRTVFVSLGDHRLTPLR
jgi:hypothetical protein